MLRISGTEPASAAADTSASAADFSHAAAAAACSSRMADICASNSDCDGKANSTYGGDAAEMRNQNARKIIGLFGDSHVNSKTLFKRLLSSAQHTKIKYAPTSSAITSFLIIPYLHCVECRIVFGDQLFAVALKTELLPMQTRLPPRALLSSRLARPESDASNI